MSSLRLSLSLITLLAFATLTGCQSLPNTRFESPIHTVNVEGARPNELVLIYFWEGTDQAEAIRLDPWIWQTREHKAIGSSLLDRGASEFLVTNLDPGSYTVGFLAWDPRENQKWDDRPFADNTRRVTWRWEVRTWEIPACDSELNVRLESKVAESPSDS